MSVYSCLINDGSGDRFVEIRCCPWNDRVDKRYDVIYKGRGIDNDEFEECMSKIVSIVENYRRIKVIS